MQTLKDTKGEDGAPFGRLPTQEQFKALTANPPDLFVRRLVCLELPDVRYADLPDVSQHAELINQVVQHRRSLADSSAARRAVITEGDVKTVLREFSTDDFSNEINKRWLLDVLKIPYKSRGDPEHLSNILETAVADFVQDLQDNALTGLSLSARALASLALYRHILVAAEKGKKPHGPLLLGPIFRLLANAKGEALKQYLPKDKCGEDVELTANCMPAYWRRMQNGVEQPVEDLSLAVASPPVMCWICGEGFLHNGALLKHCRAEHGDYAEYRKRLFWRAQKDGFKPLLPWVKRHILESATFHLTYSVPGSHSLKMSHPETFARARERTEVPCVVCARKDWLENRFTVHLWREADGSSSLSDLLGVASGNSQLLTCGDHLCFGNRSLIDKLLNTKRYCELFPLIPPEHLYASSVLHPADESVSWLLHTRRVPMVPNSRAAPQRGAEEPAAESSGSAAQPVSNYMCAGVGDKSATAYICYDCATCLCVSDKLIKMPRFALANWLWLGREHPLLQNATTGLRLLLGLGRPCFRKLLLGGGRKEDREYGTTGNHVLVSHGAPTLGDVLPPSARDLSDGFVAVFGQNKEDLTKCQLLTVKRADYRILAQDRCRVNAAFGRITVDQQRVNALPEQGVPQQLIECAVQMPEVERYAATRRGPGTIRDPLDAAQPDDDASDELADDESGEECAPGNEAEHAPRSDERPADTKSDELLNQFETPIGVDPTAAPDFVQHVAAFKAQLELVQDASKHLRADSVAQPVDQDSTSATVTAQAAAEEVRYRAVVDLREAAQKLDKHRFEEKAKLLECANNKALFVPSGKAMSMFSPHTWSKCFSEFWYGDCLPNMPHQQPRLSFEELFEALPDREELEYQLDTDKSPYRAKSQSRFDTPEHAIVFGDTLKRLLLFKGTRMALKRKGFQKDVKLIANATSEQCIAALQDSAGQPGDVANRNAEALVANAKLAQELRTALRQVLISTKEVPLTDGYKRNLRHESHNLNVTEGPLVVFATFNFADTYSPVLFRLVRDGLRPSGAEPPAEDLGEDIVCSLTDDDPNMPSLQQMHQLIAQSPRAQAKFFLLMDDIADIYFMDMDQSFIGRHRVRESFPHKYREDNLPSRAIPGLGGYGVAELEPFESQGRGFGHGHRKKYAIPKTREREVIELFRQQDPTVLHSLFQKLKVALIRCAETLQYEASTLPAKQMGQTVSPEKFTKKQQQQSRLDGGTELDGSQRKCLPLTEPELPGHHVLERRKAASEGRPWLSMYSQASLKGCHQSLMPSYRLPQNPGARKMLDEVGMTCHDTNAATTAFPPVWDIQEDAEHVLAIQKASDAGVAQPASREDLVQDANQFALSYARDFRALHQFNHDHDCTTTCIKYVAKQCKEAAQEALRKGRVVACRFWFFHILAFTYVCTGLAGIAETVTKRVRRRGKRLVDTPYIATTNDHNEFCKPILQRDTPFRSASTDVGQTWGRCNIDFQFMPRTLDPDQLLESSPAQSAVLQVNPKEALAMYGVRMRMPDEPMMRRCFHTIVAMHQASHNCDFYITKYQCKPLEQLQSLLTNMALGLQRLEAEED